MGLGPFDLTAGPFLLLYGVLLVLAVTAGAIVPRLLKPEGRERDVSDPEQLAILAGGRDRFADNVATRLLTRGALALIGRDKLAAMPGARGQNPAESRLLSLSGEFQWATALKALKPFAEPVERTLVEAGLWMDAAEAARIRFWQTFPCMMLLGFGAIRLMIGESRGKPVGFLTVLLILTAILAAMRWFIIDRRTRGGIAAVKASCRTHSRLRTAPTREEAALGVALFGTVVLAGSEWSDFHQMRVASGDGSSSGGGSDGDGGGGGCGGCGGGD